MYPCKQCLESNFEFEYLDNGFTRVTCLMCGYEFEFEKKNKKIKWECLKGLGKKKSQLRD